MTDCIFCKISAGEVPAHKVYEDENILAFLDINPHAKGHTVVIPKVHAETLFDLNEELIKLFFVDLKRVMEIIDDKLKPDGYNVGWNQNSVAGQVVPHLHVHIMPRYEGDGGGSVHSIIKNDGGFSVEDIAEKFKG